MSPQKDDKITRRPQERYTGEEDNQWILGRPMTTSRTGSLNVSTVTSMVIWQKNAEQRKKNERHGNVSNVTRWGI